MQSRHKLCTASHHITASALSNPACAFNAPPFRIHLPTRSLAAMAGVRWHRVQMEVAVEVPMHLSLEYLRGKGPQPGEALQPDVPEGE